MTDTGRLTSEIGLRTRRLIYGELGAAELEAELAVQTRVDQAHLLMLAGQRLVPRAAARSLLDCIGRLRDQRFQPLLGRPAPRGIYLMYEGYLIEQLGPDVGGLLHTGRSRNDLKATITLLRLRGWLVEFAEQASRLEAILLARARAHRNVLMPVYTHYQAALPISYGYYLLGLAEALGRELDALRQVADGLLVNPLGAGAVAGCDLPIDAEHTARLLGFSSCTRHALDAVASRDVPLRLLGTVASITITLSRLAADLQLWSTAEFGFVRFPDRLVGGSSAMPQKRNAFLLEHVRAKPALLIGAWSAAAAAMSATPFTNSIEVGTEAMASIWSGLTAAEHSVLLCQVLVSGARPVPERMAERAEQGFTTATAVANQLVQQGVAFRSAHRQVGEAVRQAIEAGSTELAGFGPDGWLAGVEPSSVQAAGLLTGQAYGGGPGAFPVAFEAALARWRTHRDWPAGLRRAAAEADRQLHAETGELLTEPAASGDAA